MPYPSKFDQLPTDIKSELIGKFLKRERYHDISEWLSQQHGITQRHSNLHRIGKPIQDKYAPLLALGMPIAEIVKHWQQIDAIGIEQAREELLSKLNAKNGDPFAYLDKPEANQ